VRARLALAALVAVGLVGIAPTPAAAHPLGNFTINQFSRLEPGPQGLTITYVVDMAEIPTFQERQAIDGDRDATISETEEAAYLDSQVPELVAGLRLEVGGVASDLEIIDRQLAFAPGAGDLPTMRLELTLRAAVGADASDTRVTSAVTNYEERAGWRDITVVAGPEATIVASSVDAEEPTDALR